MAVPGSPAEKKPTLGLDLQGGLEVVLKAVPPKGHKLTSEDIARSIDIMRKRIDKLGVSEPEIRKQGSNQIVIQLAGVHNAADAAKLIGKTAQLEFYDFEGDLTGPSISSLGQVPQASGSLFDLLSDPATISLAEKGKADQWYLFDPKHRTYVGPVPTKQKLLASTRVQKKLGGKIPKNYRILPVPHNTVVVSCDPTEGGCITGKAVKSKTYFYLLKHRVDTENPIPEMTGAELKLSGTRADFDTQTGQPIVLMQFTGKGKKIFHEITRREAQRGSIKAQGQSGADAVQQFSQHFAIVLDRKIESAPYIDFVQNPDGIPGDNGAQIQLGRGGTIGEAKQLALVLQTGALPINFTTAERTDVSATLGKDSLREATRAALVGLLIVALFLLLLYRFLGLVAVLGLAIYVAFLYAAILIFNVTLTLPGFAGMILTIGVAADANVVVFERIKEEVRAGKSVRAAIAAGYSKGFHTILDANVVTCITALVLFAVATAGVKGFALMLLIGTVISLITAVAATRAMLGLLAGFRWFDNPSLMGAHGTQVTFQTSTPQPITDVRDQMKAIGRGDAIVQGRGAQTGEESYQSYQIRSKSLETTELAQLQGDLEDSVNAKAFGIKNVSSSFGRQIAKDAILAIFFSLFLVVLYIAIRFDLKFAVPVILAMVHDVLITVGVYSVTGREVSTSTVAAVLTVLGYSIYYTIIIFARIRENIPLMRRAPFATIANISLWETIRRSLATTFITLLPVASLLFFGGDTLKDFAFALLVGVASGAYSSIFIAAPLLTMWKEREPEYVRRIGEVAVAGDGAGEAVLVAAEEAAAAEPVPDLSPVAAVERAAAGAEAKRERRRQRRRSRPH